jgi:hypothetical protein
MQHENSIKVKIFRTETFLGGAQGPDVQAYLGESKVSIGSYYTSINSATVGSGLSVEEKELLLPDFVGVSATHPDFMKKVEQWYVDIETKVPYGSGLTLEIGLEDNTKPLGTKIGAGINGLNKPLIPIDYIRYRHLLGHPYVGASKEAAEGTRKQFYIFNIVELEKRAKDLSDTKDAALVIFLEVKPDPAKVKMLLTLLGVDTKQFTGKQRNETMLIELRKLADTKPKDFIDVYSRKDFDIEYTIQEMINLGVIRKYGEKYMDPENNNALLANSLDELVFFFKQDDNSSTIIALKARLQEKTGEQPSKE